MTIEDLATSSGVRIRTTKCSLCGDRFGDDYNQFSSHLEAEHSFADLGLDRDPRPDQGGDRPPVRCDGGSVQGESDERGARSVDDIERWECSLCGESIGYQYDDLPESCPSCGWETFRPIHTEVGR